MADILIRGMEMPKVGVYTCELGVLDESTALLTIYTPIANPQRSYKAVPLPEEHGELKDSNSIITDIRQYFCQGCVCPPTSFNCQLCKITKVLSIVSEAPTIVPAEGGAENG